MYKNSSALLNNTTVWHYLGTKHLDFRHENNSTPGVLIEKIWYSYIFGSMYYQVNLYYKN